MSRPKMKIRKGDTVIVQTGSDKGRTGEVLRVLPRESRILVKGIHIVKRHVKPSQFSAGGIVEEERPIHISNVAFCYEGKATRLGVRVAKNGEKERFAKATGKVV